MKKFLLTATLLSSLAATSARAEEFYVELGRATTEAEAQAAWAALQPKHKVLANYDVFPNKILLADGSFTFRIQAGPMLDKAEADRVCRRLFKRDVSCFVIEGFDPKNSKTFEASTTSSSPVSGFDFLPWRAAKPQTVQVPVEPAAIIEQPAPVVLSAPPAEPAKGRASVDVAEAIQVPVSQEQITVGEPVQIKSVDDTATTQSSPAAKTPGWLSIQPFLDEARAQQYWSDLKKQSADAQAMSARVIHPVVSHDIPKVILAVGTFDSEETATKFCRYYVPASSYLECQFSAQPPQGREQAKGSVPSRVAADEYGLFWVQAISEKSQDKALERWEKVRTDNDDVLAGMRSQVTSSLTSPGTYVVRIGPVKSRTKASQLCDTLKARKVACSLVSL